VREWRVAATSPHRRPTGFARLHAATGGPVWFAALLLVDQGEAEERGGAAGGGGKADGGGEAAGIVLQLVLERIAARRRSGDAISERDAISRALPADGQDDVGEAAVVASDQGQGGGGGAEDRLTRRLVSAYADALTRAVLAAPAQYFWWHRRWRGEDEEHGAGV